MNDPREILKGYFAVSNQKFDYKFEKIMIIMNKRPPRTLLKPLTKHN